MLISTLDNLLGTSPGACSEALELKGEPVITTYPDGVFHNYYQHGISLFYVNDRLDRIDFYNPSSSPSTARRRKPIPWQPAPELVFDFPSTSIPIPPPPKSDKPSKPSTTTPPTSLERPLQLVLGPRTTAKELVECFGEPLKKGGTTAWIDTYIEWTVDVSTPTGEKKLGIMVELREGPGEGIELWDRAKNWEWACLKVFHA
jgi:hypothetical protein